MVEVTVAVGRRRFTRETEAVRVDVGRAVDVTAAVVTVPRLLTLVVPTVVLGVLGVVVWFSPSPARTKEWVRPRASAATNK